ncbi:MULTISPECIES: hypothetical protein [unclassified Lysinibacillus]|uniref:hypothetical protein n=1 Tax=unclassified Lysinibacillus TaxID=2636778 RepID=UPI0020121EF4|nr:MULTISPECIES: hypothetical protein [unclassified Lysinibacillus]MCL1697446.1 hypothetical protein [Lysinibacillus sp. BPa_S21]MCL1702088.1 hypothetical protein [Lysinibacillus sp. Bpr_S20]
MFSVRKRSANVAAATKVAHRTPPGSSALRESEASAANVFSVAKAKRQLQSAQSERKSTIRYGH